MSCPWHVIYKNNRTLDSVWVCATMIFWPLSMTNVSWQRSHYCLVSPLQRQFVALSPFQEEHPCSTDHRVSRWILWSLPILFNTQWMALAFWSCCQHDCNKFDPPAAVFACWPLWCASSVPSIVVPLPPMINHQGGQGLRLHGEHPDTHLPTSWGSRKRVPQHPHPDPPLVLCESLCGRQQWRATCMLPHMGYLSCGLWWSMWGCLIHWAWWCRTEHTVGWCFLWNLAP
jgi:hypothetical protein